MERVAFRGISREYLPVPGETLAEVLEDRGISPEELAARTTYRESFISRVINGNKPISKSMARHLEEVLGVEAEFWINLQAAYDEALARLNEEDGINDEEKKVFHELHENKVVDDVLCQWQTSAAVDGPIENEILALRKVFGLSTLSDLAGVVPQGAFRLGAADVKPSVMGAWLLLARRLTNREPGHAFDVKRVPQLIEHLKVLLNSDRGSDLPKSLADLFSEYGIVFAVAPHFSGAPVQGYIAPIGSNGYRMILTIRCGRADLFWFTLFHELGHIVNGDLDHSESFMDPDTNSDAPQEQKANAFARQILINESDYEHFVSRNDFSDRAIKEFANLQNVPMWIVKGRLQRDKHVSWRNQSGIHSYKWAKHD